MNATISHEFKAVVGKLVQQRQEYLAQLKPESSMVKIMYKGKTLLCVYMRHTTETITVKTTKEIVDHFWNNGTLCLSGPFTEVNIKFPLNEVQIANG